NCAAPDQQTLDLAPVGAGPLLLAAVYCQTIRSSVFPRSAPVVSPDGRSIAYYEHATVLRVARLDEKNNWMDYPADLGVFARFGSGIRTICSRTGGASQAVRWRACSLPCTILRPDRRCGPSARRPPQTSSFPPRQSVRMAAMR